MDERLGGDWAPILVSPIQWRQVVFLFTEHLEMTKDPTFTDNILFLLLEEPHYNGFTRDNGAVFAPFAPTPSTSTRPWPVSA